MSGWELGTRTQLARFKGALTALVLPLLAAGQGVEPWSPLSESGVLPLNEPAMLAVPVGVEPTSFQIRSLMHFRCATGLYASPTGFEPASIRLRRAMRFHCATGRNWSGRMELNHRREAFQTSALPLSYDRIETGERGRIRTYAGITPSRLQRDRFGLSRTRTSRVSYRDVAVANKIVGSRYCARRWLRR